MGDTLNRFQRPLLRSFILLILMHTAVDAVIAQGRSLTFQYISDYNGVPLGKINAFTQDKYGYLWLSDQTNHCIIRFDGTGITRYFHDPSNTNSMGGHYPEALCPDSAGNIWIGYWGMGLDKFNPHTNTFTHYRHNKDDPKSLSSDSVSSLLIDREGTLWVGTQNGLNLLDEEKGIFHHFKHDPGKPKSISGNRIRSIVADREGEIWVGTGFIWYDFDKGGLNKFNKSTKDFTRFVHDPADPASISDNNVRCIFEDSFGNFWVGTGGIGIQTLDRKTGKFTRYPFDPDKPELLSRSRPRHQYDHVTFIMEDAAKQVWFGTYAGGVVRYDPLTKHVERINKGLTGTQNVNDTTAWAGRALEDGTVWISTELNNLFKTDVLPKKLPFYRMDGATFGESLLEKNKAWFCAEAGLMRQDVVTGRNRMFRPDPSNPKALGGAPFSIIRDHTGAIWVSTSNGLYQMNEADDSFKPFRLIRDSAGMEPNLLSLFEDTGGRIWITSINGGLFMINRERRTVKHYLNDPAQPSIGGNTPVKIVEYKDQEYLIANGFNSGLTKYDLKTNSWSSYMTGLSSLGMERDQKGIYWAGTDNGVFRYDPVSDQFINLASEGTVNFLGVVRAMTIDRNDNIWVSSHKSIFRINTQKDAITEFGDYFLSPESGMLRYVTAKSFGNKVYFGCDNGYYLFDSDSLDFSNFDSKLLLSRFWINNRELKPSSDGPLKEPLPETASMELGHAQNNFSLSFSVINFKYPARSVQYKLEPYDIQWRVGAPDERIAYNNLPAGNYQLKFRTSTPGKWITREVSIIIHPPWWQSFWAYLLYGLLAIAAIYFFVWYQRKRVREQEQLKASKRELEQAREIEKAYHQLKSAQTQLVQAEKMASLGELTAGIAHEIQNPLNFVNNFSEINSELSDEIINAATVGDLNEVKSIAADIKANQQKIAEHGRRADSIVKAMLQHSRSNTGHKEPTDINKLADEYLRLAYHGLRAKDKQFNASISSDLDPGIGMIAVNGQDIGRVLLNIYNNAFFAVNAKSKQGSPQFQPAVKVTTRKMGENVRIEVSDNGIGIPEKLREKIFQPFFTTKPTGQGTGLGLSLSYDIITAHGGKIQVESAPGEGSTFIIELPFNREVI